MSMLNRIDSYLVLRSFWTLSIQLFRLYGHFTDNTSLRMSDAEGSERQFICSSTATLHACMTTIHFWADLCAGKKARLITSHHYIIDAEHSRGYEVSDPKKFMSEAKLPGQEALPWKTSCPAQILPGMGTRQTCCLSKEKSRPRRTSSSVRYALWPCFEVGRKDWVFLGHPFVH